ncbi:hypothetical protein [Rathayibacter sp. AY1C2]|uniref:hypothetical protein n=1 Tax=Rathayibacter sp. AY1C2 TaxID=2080535 RepID=UPI0015E2ED91|nr:hypothetical protein [Rathayibacter sp. AY1C2]
MSTITAQTVQSADLADLATAHDTFTAADEIGTDAASEAPATTPFCAGVIIGVTLTAGC